MNRITCIIAISILISCSEREPMQVASVDKPNIILVMADDLGWGDVAYNGNPVVKTPHLDAMASEGLRLDRFYAAAPVCSPTRASCLTGKHPYRVDIPWAGDGAMPEEENTLAETLKSYGYTTGHFGKWHVGGLSRTVKQSYFPGPPTPYSPPWENGFDVSFSTESMVPTYNPYYHIGGEYGTEDYRHVQTEPVALGQRTDGFRWRDYYWTGEGEIVDQWLEGEDAEIVMDKALEFIGDQAETKQPFLAVIWFHNVHSPIVAGDNYRQLYSEYSMEEQHWYGNVTAMDEQIGRLRDQLQTMKVADNTILWFCSDNGPSYIHDYNSAGPFRGKKADLLEGGICVPGILEWPQRFDQPGIIKTPIGTSDFYPTLLAMAGIDQDLGEEIDGENVLPILKGVKDERQEPIGFRSPLPGRLRKQETQNEEQWAWVGNRYKLLTMDNGETFQLYDIVSDQHEMNDLSQTLPEVATAMKEQMMKWSNSLDNE
jgi:arylsulfatase A-like enzyme